METQHEQAAPAGSRPPASRLRRELRLVEAVGLSIALMTPTLAVALNGVLPAGFVGRAVPLAFAFAAVGIVLVSYGFIRLSRYFSGAGSVYYLSGATLGPRAGFFAGWALLGTYWVSAGVTMVSMGIFGSAFLQETGLWPHASWLLIAVVGLAAAWLAAFFDVRLLTRSLLTLEGISVTLILILIGTIIYDLASGSAPHGQTITASVFVLPKGAGLGALGVATVFGFLSFAGFEGSAALGEETNNPHRNIPLAIVGTVVFAAVFYVLAMCAEVWGFGTGAPGVKEFAASSAPVGELARMYVGAGMSNAVNFGALVSSFAGTIGLVTAGARVLYAMGRDGFVTGKLGMASPRTGAPATALAVLVVATFACVLGLRIFATSSDLDIFFWLGTLATFLYLTAYVVTNAGAISYLFIRGRRAPRWEIVIPLIGILFLLYTFWKNVSPVPAFPYNLFPYIDGAWLVIALVIVFAFPRFAQRIGLNLAAATEQELTDRGVGRSAESAG